MNFEEYKKVIVNNSDKENWIINTCWGFGSGPSYLNKFTVWNNGRGEFNNLEIESHGEIAVLKSNLSISIAWGLPHNNDFKEEWANKFPDPKATSSFIDFFFNGILVYRDIYVSVDGARAYIPLPKRDIDDKTYEVKRLYIEKERYKFFELINLNTDNYHRYVKRCGIEFLDKAWG